MLTKLNFFYACVDYFTFFLNVADDNQIINKLVAKHGCLLYYPVYCELMPSGVKPNAYVFSLSYRFLSFISLSLW